MKKFILILSLALITSCSFINKNNTKDTAITEGIGSIVNEEVLSDLEIQSIIDKENQKQLEEYNKTLIIKYEKYLKDTKIDILQIKKKELSTNEYNDFVKELDELNNQALEDYKNEIFTKYQ